MPNADSGVSSAQLLSLLLLVKALWVSFGKPSSPLNP